MPFRFNPFTDKLDLTETGGGGGSGILTVTGDTGGAVGPSAGGNLNLIGDKSVNGGVVTVKGTAGTNTEVVSIFSTAVNGIPIVSNGGINIPASFGVASVEGGGTGFNSGGLGDLGTILAAPGGGGTTVARIFTDFAGKVLTAKGNAILPAYQWPTQGMSANGVVYAASATTTLSSTAAGTTGQVLTATTGSAPTWAAPPTALNSNGYFNLSADLNNVTGDGTQYTILWSQTAFQNGSDISYDAGTGVFTCNTSGIYLFIYNLTFQQLVADNTNVWAYLQFSIGNSGPFIADGNVGVNNNSGEMSNGKTYNCTGMINWAATDTMIATVQVDGNATKNVQLLANIGTGNDGNFLQYIRIN